MSVSRVCSEKTNRGTACRNITRSDDGKCNVHRNKIQVIVETKERFQCESVTSRNVRCTLTTFNENRRCHLHQNERHPEQIIKGVRCEGLKPNGEQCSLMTHDLSKKCHLHNKPSRENIKIVKKECTYVNSISVKCKTLTTSDEQRCPYHSEWYLNRCCKAVLNNGERCRITNRLIDGYCEDHRPKPIDGCPFRNCSTSKANNIKYCLKHEAWVKLLSGRVDTLCAICLEETEELDTIECGHRFHYTCLIQITKSVCPVCRSSLKNTLTYRELTIISERNIASIYERLNAISSDND